MRQHFRASDRKRDTVMEVLVRAENFSEDAVVIGFMNSNNELEYTTYQRVDGGIVQCAQPSDLKELGQFTAEAEGVEEYSTYHLKEV